MVSLPGGAFFLRRYTSLKLGQIPFPCLHAEMGLQPVHLVVGDGIEQGQVGDLPVDFRRLFGGLDEAEGFVQVFARAVDAVLRPNDKAGGLHLLRRGNADLMGAAEHPRQHVYAIREHHDTLGTHLPEGAGERFFIQAVDMGHGQQVCRVAVHDHMVLEVDFQPCGVAHHVGGKLGGESAAVREAPEKLRRFAAVCQPHKAEVHLRGELHVLEILARAGDEEVFTLQRRAGKARGNLPQNLAVHRIGCFAILQQQAHIAAVALVPAVVVPIRYRADHLHHPRRCQNILHSASDPDPCSRRSRGFAPDIPADRSPFPSTYGNWMLRRR